MTLYGLLFASVTVGRGIAALEYEKPLEIDITGYQWWWHVKYPGEQPYLDALNTALDTYKRELGGAGIDYRLINTSEPLEFALMAYLSTRGRAR